MNTLKRPGISPGVPMTLLLVRQKLSKRNNVVFIARNSGSQIVDLRNERRQRAARLAITDYPDVQTMPTGEPERAPHGG